MKTTVLLARVGRICRTLAIERMVMLELEAEVREGRDHQTADLLRADREGLEMILTDLRMLRERVKDE